MARYSRYMQCPVWVASSLVFLAAGFGGRGLSAQDLSALVDEVLPNVVTLVSYSGSGSPVGQGSGFVLQDGRLATNIHVVAGAAWVEVLDSEGNIVGTVPFAEVVSPRADLAILPGWTGLGNGLPLSADPPSLGSRIVVIGSPQGLENTVSDGLVSGRRELNGLTLIQVSAPISPGSSGGPVLNTRGEVVGVAVSQFTTGQNLNFAVPASELAALMRSPAGKLALSELRISDQVDSSADEVVDAVLEAFDDSPVLRENEPTFGALAPGDVKHEGQYQDWYRIPTRAGQTISVAMLSSELDAQLGVFTADRLRTWLSAPADSLVLFNWFNDDYAGTNAALDLTPAEDGHLYVVATSFDTGEQGDYEIAWFSGRLEDLLAAADSAPDNSVDSRWTYSYSFDADGTMVDVYWDSASLVELAPSRYEVWFMWGYEAPSITSDGDEIDEVRALWEVNCGRQRMQQLQWFRYLRGEQVTSETTPGDWIRPIPGSILEGMLDAVCH